MDFQNSLFTSHFTTVYPVLDIGCGFGRQSILFAKQGFQVAGVDTSKVFIEIAKDLFDKHQLPGSFAVSDINGIASSRKFKQIILLDVLEHIPLSKRKNFVRNLFDLAEPDGIVILSLPHVKPRLSSILNNRVRRRITQYILFFKNKKEHPFPIPEINDVRKLLRGKFEITYFSGSSDSDYYVLKRE